MRVVDNLPAFFRSRTYLDIALIVAQLKDFLSRLLYIFVVQLGLVLVLVLASAPDFGQKNSRVLHFFSLHLAGVSIIVSVALKVGSLVLVDLLLALFLLSRILLLGHLVKELGVHYRLVIQVY